MLTRRGVIRLVSHNLQYFLFLDEFTVLYVFTAPPKFGGDIKDTVTLNLGASHVVELPFTANPMPKVTWTYNDGNLPDAKRFKSQTISGMTSLTMAKIVLKDAGNYKVTLENENGQASFTVKLIVLGMQFIILDYFSILNKFSN